MGAIIVILLFLSFNISAQKDSTKINYSFITAADRGDLDAVKRLIHKGVI